ncbi:MAG: DUF4867 family protein [Pseudobutyrivibrio sp.]|nr:DUF4867 family protein [Pseudobutyrivibrio sp.]
MEILSVKDPEFKKYGVVWEGFDFAELESLMMATECPEDVIYVPSDKAMEATKTADALSKRVYGSLPIQIGYCNGHNDTLNALEYHRGSEVNVPFGGDMILMLGLLFDVEADYTYDTSKVKAFLVPEGTAVELFGTTLHYAPCGVDGAGFRGMVVLPQGTNYEMNFTLPGVGEDKLMTHTNKWLIAHPEAGIEGAFAGLKGENLKL